METNQVSKIFNPIKETVLAFSSFNLRLSDLGIFQNWSQPRIFWIGLDDKEEILKKLKKRLELELSNMSFLRDMKSFSPHLTLARLRSPNNKNLLKKEIEKVSVPLDHLIKVSEIKLFSCSLKTKLKFCILARK